MKNETVLGAKLAIARRPLRITLFMSLIWYIEIILFQVPLFSLIVCPIGIVGTIALSLFRNKKDWYAWRRTLCGVPAIFATTAILSVTFSQMHDRWLMKQARDWGSGLRDERRVTGKYPESTRRILHNYYFQFVNLESPSDAPPAIYFNKFDSIWQGYLVTEDRFLPESER